MIPAQRRSPEPGAPRVAVSVSVPPQRAPERRPPVSAPPVRRTPPPVQMNIRLAPPPMRAPLQEPEDPSDRSPRSLPTWTKICVVLGAVLILVGFGGLGAAYAVNQQADPTTAGTELIQR